VNKSIKLAKKRLMNTFKSFLFLILISSYTIAQPQQKKWTLEDCINYAIDNNIQLQQQKISTQITKNNLLQSKMSLLPTLSMSANHNYMTGHTIDPFTNEFIPNNSTTENFSLSSSVALFNGFRLKNNVKVQKFNHKASLLQLDKIKNNIIINVATAYMQVLYNKENMQMSEYQYSTTKEQLENARKMYNAGATPIDNVLDAEAQVATSESQMVSAQNNYYLSVINLMQTMNMKSIDTSNFMINTPQIKEPDPNLLLLPVDSFFYAAVKNLPDLQYSEAMLKAKEYQLKMEQGNRSPRIFLSVSYGTGYSDARKKGTYTPVLVPSGFLATDSTPVLSYQMQYHEQPYPFMDQIKDNASTTISLGISFPIFNGYQTSTQIKNARLSLYQAKLDKDNTYNELYKTIFQAYQDTKAAYKKYLAQKKSFEAQKKSFENLSKKYKLGLVKYVDYNVAKNNYFKSQNQMLQSKYEYIFKMLILNFYKGEKFDL